MVSLVSLSQSYHQSGGCRCAGCRSGRSRLYTDTRSFPLCSHTPAGILRCCPDTRPHLDTHTETAGKQGMRGSSGTNAHHLLSCINNSIWVRVCVLSDVDTRVRNVTGTQEEQPCCPITLTGGFCGWMKRLALSVSRRRSELQGSSLSCTVLLKGL